MLRFKHPLSESALEQANTDFADILNSGTFTQTGGLDDEQDGNQRSTDWSLTSIAETTGVYAS